MVWPASIAPTTSSCTGPGTSPAEAPTGATSPPALSSTTGSSPVSANSSAARPSPLPSAPAASTSPAAVMVLVLWSAATFRSIRASARSPVGSTHPSSSCRSLVWSRPPILRESPATSPSAVPAPTTSTWPSTRTPLREGMLLQIRVEAYNTFNHASFNAMDVSAQFNASSTVGSSQISPTFPMTALRVVAHALCNSPDVQLLTPQNAGTTPTQGVVPVPLSRGTQYR